MQNCFQVARLASACGAIHLHKGVGWAGKENPCIYNHLMQPMTTTGCLQPFLPPIPSSLAEEGVRLNTHNS